MGMFDKDKQFAPDGRLDEEFPPGPTDSREGAQCVIWGVEDKGDFNTDVGVARMTWLTVSDLMFPETKKVVGTLSSAIAEKSKEAEDSDFPAVVKILRVSSEKGNDALVLNWLRVYDPAIAAEENQPKAETTTAEKAKAGK